MYALHNMGKGNNTIVPQSKGNNTDSYENFSIGLKTPSFLSVSNSPITSGIINIDYNNTPLPVYAGGTGLTAVGAKGQILSIISSDPEQLGWVSVEGTGTVTSVAVTVPDFLQVSQTPITSSGSFDISLSSLALPTTSGGTGLTTIGNPSQILSVNTEGTSLEYSTPLQAVSSVSLSSTTPFISVSSTPVTSTGTLSVDCSTIPVSYGGTGLDTLGLPAQILTVDSFGTGLEYTTAKEYVSSVSIESATPFLTVSPNEITSTGTLVVDCLTIPISHGGTGLNQLGNPNQVLSVTMDGTALEYTTLPPPPPPTEPLTLSTSTSFIELTPANLNEVSINCSTIPISHGGTGLVIAGQDGQLLASNGTSLYWKDPITTDNFLTSIETVTPLTYTNGQLAITSFTGTGSKVVYDTSPVLTTPILGDAICSTIALNGQERGAVRLASKSGSYSFIFPETIGRPTDLLTSEGAFRPTSWSSSTGTGSVLKAPPPTLPEQTGQVLAVISSNPVELGWVDGSGLGTVQSISMTVPDFLTVSTSEITLSGSFDIRLSSQPIPVTSGGTGLTSTGSAKQVLRVNEEGTNLEYYTPEEGTVTSVTLVTNTPFISVSTDSVTSTGFLSIDCSTIPISSGGTGLETLGSPSQILAVNSTGTALEYSNLPQSVTSVSISSSTPFLSVSTNPITSTGILTIDCSTIPISHGGTGLITLGLASQILTVNSLGTGLEYTTPQFLTDVQLSTTTPFISLSSNESTTSKILSIDCGIIPISSGGTGLTTIGQQGQILTSDGTLCHWSDPPSLESFLTTINVLSPLSYTDNILSIAAFNGSGQVVCDNSPQLLNPSFVDPVTNNITLFGSQSGTVTITSVSGSYNFILPSSLGERSQVLMSQGIFNPLQWTSTSGSGDILCSQNPILGGQVILNNGTVVCKSTFIESKGIVTITGDTILTMDQFISFIIIDSSDPITITIPTLGELHTYMGDLTIGNRLTTLIHNKCPNLTILTTDGISLIEGRATTFIPVQTCTYIMTNADEGLLLIK